jgi:hypothetical protein
MKIDNAAAIDKSILKRRDDLRTDMKLLYIDFSNFVKWRLLLLYYHGLSLLRLTKDFTMEIKYLFL